MFGQPQTCRKDVQKYHELRDAASNDIGITSIYSRNYNSIESKSSHLVPLCNRVCSNHHRLIPLAIRRIADFNRLIWLS